MKVSSLIEADRGEWNETMVNEMFQVVEASKILAIPLSKKFVLDKLIWNDFVIGMFLVKSAYFKTREWLRKDCHFRENRSPLWKAIRQTKVIPKVSLFAWRLIHNLIPSIGNLRGRGL